MTDPDDLPSTGSDKKSFDMYHFFSRKDMVLAGAVIIILLILILAYFLKPAAV